MLSNLKNQFVPLLHRKLHRGENREKVTREPRITLTRKIYGSMVNLTVTNHALTDHAVTNYAVTDHGARVMSELVAYVDGGSLGNPGPSGIGVVIDGCESGPIRIAKWIGHQDNNVAEYAALLEALQWAVKLKAKALHVYSDSQVVVRQMLGEYTCRSARLYSLHWTCRKLARGLNFSISHVPREDNAEANGLAQSAVRERTV
jgi:ribonuclease HI